MLGAQEWFTRAARGQMPVADTSCSWRSVVVVRSWWGMDRELCLTKALTLSGREQEQARPYTRPSVSYMGVDGAGYTYMGQGANLYSATANPASPHTIVHSPGGAVAAILWHMPVVCRFKQGRHHVDISIDVPTPGIGCWCRL